MRTRRPAHLVRTSLPFLAALALGLAGCSLFDRSGDASGSGSSPPAAAAPVPTTAVYTVNKPCDDNPNIVIQRVTVEPAVTRVEMSYTNRAKGPVDIMLAPPGDPEVMFLEAPGGKRATMKSAEGISIMPKRDKVAVGETKTFTILFDPLPPGTRSFDLFEGEQGKMAKIGSGSFWVFRNVQLK